MTKNSTEANMFSKFKHFIGSKTRANAKFVTNYSSENDGFTSLFV